MKAQWWIQGGGGGGLCSQGVFFTEALAEFQHVSCMIIRIWEVKRVACYARAETFTEADATVASMVATSLPPPPPPPPPQNTHTKNSFDFVLLTLLVDVQT